MLEELLTIGIGALVGAAIGYAVGSAIETVATVVKKYLGIGTIQKWLDENGYLSGEIQNALDNGDYYEVDVGLGNNEQVTFKAKRVSKEIEGLIYA